MASFVHQPAAPALCKTKQSAAGNAPAEIAGREVAGVSDVALWCAARERQDRCGH